MLWEHLIVLTLTMLGGFVFIANTALGRVCFQLLTEYIEVSSREEDAVRLQEIHTETVATRLGLTIVVVFNLYLLYTITAGLSDSLKILGAIANTFAIKKLFDFDSSYKKVTKILNQYIKP